MADESLGLLQRARSGSDRAVQQLVSRLEPHMRLVIRRRLPRLLRSRFDSEDFLQAVWQSFLTGSCGLEEFSEFSDLRRHLGRVATNKVLMAVRGQLETAARDMRLEVSISDVDANSESFRIEPVARHSGPASTALAMDERRRLLERLTPEQTRILELREYGHTAKEIAASLRLSTRSIERALVKIREAMEWQT